MNSEFDPYDSLVPIFIDMEIPRRLEQVATGVFVEIEQQPFLLTAAHVTDTSANGELLAPTSEGLSPIEGYVSFVDLPPGMSRANDVIDVAYYRLSLRFADQLCHHFIPMPANRREIVQTALELGVCSASGYPITKAKKNGSVRSSEVFSFRGVAASEEMYKKLSLSPTMNIVIRFHKDRAVRPEDGKRFPTPSLRGISGGAIFAWPHGAELSSDWSLPRLVGLVHSYREREGLVIGTTLLPILTAISLGQMKGFGGVR